MEFLYPKQDTSIPVAHSQAPFAPVVYLTNGGAKHATAQVYSADVLQVLCNKLGYSERVSEQMNFSLRPSSFSDDNIAVYCLLIGHLGCQDLDIGSTAQSQILMSIC